MEVENKEFSLGHTNFKVATRLLSSGTECAIGYSSKDGQEVSSFLIMS